MTQTNHKIINLTPHIVNYKGHEFKPEAKPAKVKEESFNLAPIYSNDIEIEIVATKFGAVENLPNEEEETWYIVSSIVKAANPHRNDLLVPKEFSRDEKGNITGCNKFSR